MTAVLCRGVLHGLLGGVVQTRNMYTCEVTPSDGGDLPEAMYEYIESTWDPVQAYISTAFQLTLLEIQLQDEGHHWVPLTDLTFSWAGTAGGDMLANLMAVVLIGKSGGLRGIGRKFMAGLAESAAVGNVLTSAAAVAFASSALFFVTSYVATDLSVVQPGILDKSNTFRPFIGGFMSSLLGTCRRRKPGRGI